ncbi:hypothetical protein IF803_23250 [Bradyrhizobium sp. UFLA06-06]
MGKLKDLWNTYRKAASAQRELTNAFARATGVNFMHLDTAFTRCAIKRAMETNDIDATVREYAPLIESVKIFSGSIVTPEFNRRLLALLQRHQSPAM